MDTDGKDSRQAEGL